MRLAIVVDSSRWTPDTLIKDSADSTFNLSRTSQRLYRSEVLLRYLRQRTFQLCYYAL